MGRMARIGESLVRGERMKIIIMSDNHGQKMALQKVFEYYQSEPEVQFIHCGDSEFPYEDAIFQECLRVTGNCDYDTNYPEVAVLEAKGIRFLVTHGHMQAVNSGVYRLAKFAKEQGAQVAFYGHTHKLYEETYEGVLCINSGSVSYPRGHFSMTPTYAVLTIHSESEIELQYFDMKHHPLEGLHYKYHLDTERGFIHD